MTAYGKQTCTRGSGLRRLKDVMLLRRATSLLCIVPLVSFAGCSNELWQSTAAGSNAAVTGIHGSVHGGQQPVALATIQLYGVGTGGDKSAAMPLLKQAVATDANGNFNITGLYSCTGVTQVYLTATGGIPGGSLVNNNLAMMTALGACSSLSAATTVSVNELTTVAAVSALEPYMASYTAVGSGTSDAGALASAFALAAEYVDPAVGQAPGQGIPAGYSDPISLINTLGDILSSCINSSGGAAGSNTACGSLFTLATPAGGTAPADTIQALIDIDLTPAVNTAPLYAQALASGPFQPSLAASPASFQLNLAPTTVSRTLYTFPESDNGVTPLYTLVNNAQRTIDMTMYELVDTTFSADLVAACNRGVKVRVILDQNNEKSSNTPAYNQLNATPNCQAVWANPQFSVTHEKSFIVDERQAAILSLNLTSRYYSDTRDYGIVENDVNDIAAMQATFNTDYGSTTDLSYQPGAGDDLIWSPTTADADLVNMIANAQSTLMVENEEMSASDIVAALESACQRGVTVKIAMTDTGSYHTTFSALEAAGCGVHTGANSTSVLYIHAKAIVADLGTPQAMTYMGSINFSTNSLTKNRELGLYINDPNIQQTLSNTILADYNSFPAYVAH